MKKEKKLTKTIPFRVVLILLVLAAVVTAIIISGPTDKNASPIPKTPTPIPTSFILSPVVTDKVIPPEHNQTDGVILAGVVVVVIICLGTMLTMKNPPPRG